MLSKGSHILRDPGAASWDHRMFAVKVYYKIEKSSWALTLTESVPEAFKYMLLIGQSAKRSSRVIPVFSYMT